MTGSREVYHNTALRNPTAMIDFRVCINFMGVYMLTFASARAAFAFASSSNFCAFSAFLRAFSSSLARFFSSFLVGPFCSGLTKIKIDPLIKEGIICMEYSLLFLFRHSTLLGQSDV